MRALEDHGWRTHTSKRNGWQDEYLVRKKTPCDCAPFLFKTGGVFYQHRLGIGSGNSSTMAKLREKGVVVTQVGGNDLGPPGKRTGYLDLVVQVNQRI